MTQDAVHEREPGELEANLKSRNTWIRFLYMVMFAVFFGIAEFVLTVVVVFQFFATLITGRSNEQLKEFGASLSRYCYDILRYLTFNSEDHPFPFSDWPRGDSSEPADS